MRAATASSEVIFLLPRMISLQYLAILFWQPPVISLYTNACSAINAPAVDIITTVQSPYSYD